MRLREALLVACDFAQKEGPLAYVVCTPPGIVWAGDGETHVKMCLDAEEANVPHVAMEAKALKKVLNADKDHTLFYLERATDTVTVVRSPAYTVHVPSAPVEQVAVVMTDPTLPARVLSPEALAGVESVMHAASAPDAPGKLGYLHLTPEYIEATDQTRISRVAIGLHSDPCLVPKKLFAGVPSKLRYGASLVFQNQWVFFQVDEQLRSSKVYEDKDYVRLDTLIPDRSVGYVTDIVRKDFSRAIRTARASSDVDVVELAFPETSGPGTMQVCGMAESGQVKAGSPLQAYGKMGRVRIPLRGRALMDALQATDSQVVRLSYSTPGGPIRLDSVGHVEVLWPMMLPPEVQNAGG